MGGDHCGVSYQKPYENFEQGKFLDHFNITGCFA